MSLGLFEIGEWPRNLNNGVRAFDVGPCGDGGVPLPVKPTANMKDRIGPNHPVGLNFGFAIAFTPLIEKRAGRGHSVTKRRK